MPISNRIIASQELVNFFKHKMGRNWLTALCGLNPAVNLQPMETLRISELARANSLRLKLIKIDR